MAPGPDASTWLEVTADALPVGDIYDWCVRPNCGAVVLFSGVVRDHADGREGVTHLEYEAYADMVIPRLDEIANEARRRWPEVECIALLHRIGTLKRGDSSVVVAASAPHRPTSFEVSRFAIDALKVSVPVWKREVWPGGEEWGTNSAEVTSVADFAASYPQKGAAR